MKHYTFKCYDDETSSTSRIEFSTDNVAWTGHDGPMQNFFLFLRGCGFIFDINEQIGIIDEEDEFRGALDNED